MKLAAIHLYSNPHLIFWMSIFSLAVHPDKITIATGQVAGHDKKEGKVCVVSCSVILSCGKQVLNFINFAARNVRLF